MFWLRFTRPAAISTLEVGTVVIEGQVVADRTLVIAGSQTRPVFFDMTIESYQTATRGRGRPMWIPSKAEQQIVPFFLEDATAKIWVVADLTTTRVSGGRREVGVTSKSGRARYVATLFSPGDVVRVRGEVGDARKGEPTPRVIRGSSAHPIEILFRRVGRR